MIPVIYNRVGIACIGLGCLAAFAAWPLQPWDGVGVPMLALGAVCCIADLGYRFYVGWRGLLHPRRGGHLYFIPTWILGVLFLWFGIGLFRPEWAEYRKNSGPAPVVLPPRHLTTKSSASS